MLTEFRPLAMNWVITDRCPLRCVHCLNGHHGPGPSELTPTQRLRIVEAAASLGVRRLSIIGGEPFILPELPLLVEHARRHDVDVNVTTSGVVADRAVLERMRAGVEYLNVSLDGGRSVNDRLRGEGVHARATAFARLARAVGIPLRLYVVLSTANATDEGLRDVTANAVELGVRTVMLIAFSPLGAGASMHELRPTAQACRSFFERCRDALTSARIEVKHADPYEPESQKVFIDPHGELYVPQGRFGRRSVGHLLREPTADFALRLAPADASQHLREYADRRDRPRRRLMGRLGPEGMAWVPPGVFRMGGGERDRDRLAHPVYVSGCYLDVHPVTNRQYAAFLNAMGRHADDRLWLDLDRPECLIRLDGSHYEALAGYEQHPAVCVTWYGAAAYATWVGRRLPTEAEWEKAARGGREGAIYPWGDEPPGDRCNWRDYDGPGGKQRADFYKGRGPTPVGLFAPNGYGLYDVAGNVWQWCADWLDADAYGHDLRIDPMGPEGRRFKVARGGAYSFDPVNLRCAHRGYALPEAGYPWTGFRTAIGGIDWLCRTEAA